MTEQSPQPSHELARDTDAQPSEHEPAIAANETFPFVENKVPDDVAHEKDAESGDATGKEGGTEARDVKNEESNDKKSGHDEDNFLQVSSSAAEFLRLFAVDSIQ